MLDGNTFWCNYNWELEALLGLVTQVTIDDMTAVRHSGPMLAFMEIILRREAYDNDQNILRARTMWDTFCSFSQSTALDPPLYIPQDDIHYRNGTDGRGVFGLNFVRQMSYALYPICRPLARWFIGASLTDKPFPPHDAQQPVNKWVLNPGVMRFPVAIDGHGGYCEPDLEDDPHNPTDDELVTTEMFFNILQKAPSIEKGQFPNFMPDILSRVANILAPIESMAVPERGRGRHRHDDNKPEQSNIESMVNEAGETKTRTSVGITPLARSALRPGRYGAIESNDSGRVSRRVWGISSALPNHQPSAHGDTGGQTARELQMNANFGYLSEAERHVHPIRLRAPDPTGLQELEVDVDADLRHNSWPRRVISALGLPSMTTPNEVRVALRRETEWIYERRQIRYRAWLDETARRQALPDQGRSLRPLIPVPDPSKGRIP